MNTKSDIPYGNRIEPEETTLNLPELPGDWEWGSANHSEMTHKVNLYFGLEIYKTGGQYGEIDNWTNNDGEEVWTLHVRPIVDVPNKDRNRPRTEAETSEDFETLGAAIGAVPDHIGTYYEHRLLADDIEN